jgi:capsular exopolysaccharide synthesis family protein
LAKLIKRKLHGPEVVMVGTPRSVAAERFRRLKTLLNNDPSDPRVMVVTSAGPGEGKSVTAVNLALAVAADMKGEVLLIDADLRRPTVDRWLDPPPKLGLAELLRGQTEPDHAILEMSNTPLRVLPAGEPPADPSELLASEFSRALMEDLRTRFHKIVIDTPPIVPFTDADVIGGLSDGVVLVTRAGSTPVSSYKQAVASVSSTRILGTVLNDLTFSLADRESYHSYARGYHEYYSKERR